MTEFSEDDYLFTTEAGVRWYYREEGDTVYIGSVQDAEPVLEANHEMATMNDGWNADRSMRRVGSIPFNLITKWKNEDGVDLYDENCAREVIRRLNSREFHRLRSADWNV